MQAVGTVADQNDRPDDDEVVGEIDVYLSRPPEHYDLHIWQYPLRHTEIGLGTDRRVVGANIRPQHGRVEVKLAVLPDDPMTTGDEFGCVQPSARSFDTAQQDAGEKAIGQIQKLRSRANLILPNCNYAVATLVSSRDHDDAVSKSRFVLVPVHSVSQLRPAFDYLDEHDISVMRRRAEEKILRMNARGETIPGSQDGAQDDVAPLQVNFRRRESERAAERRRNSHATLREKEEGEAWIELDYAYAASEESKLRWEQLFGTSSADAIPAKEEDVFEGNPKYTNLFLDHTKAARLDVTVKSTLNAEATSSRALKNLAINAAVQQVLLHARIASFNDIARLVGDRPLKEVLTAVRMAAYCLRGCWVAKKGKKDFRRQPSANERYDACRILILDLFRKNRVVTTKMAENSIGDRLVISEGTILSILREVAELCRGQGWEFKVHDDTQFLLKYGALCRSQEAEWDSRVAKAREVVSKSMGQGKKQYNIV